MSIAARLEMIERLLLSPTCLECGAGGGDDEEPEIRQVSPEEAGKPCPTCGGVPRVIRMPPVRLSDDSGSVTRS